MPTILRFRNFRIMIFTDDHGPPHVHAIGAGGEAIFLLNNPAGPVSLRQSSSLKYPEENALADFLDAHLELLCEAWEKLHDQSA